MGAVLNSVTLKRAHDGLGIAATTEVGMRGHVVDAGDLAAAGSQADGSDAAIDDHRGETALPRRGREELLVGVALVDARGLRLEIGVDPGVVESLAERNIGRAGVRWP